ncbi:2OG-Fe(II) oxygenase [Thiomicrospira aerophila AL3]|uniref:2OG-Fe(II) oxygenase n=1 Tax=Thiomicrospira aerophila AL3 TaxID=717772 RepID=W0DYD5_9GAMM|nr:2OG-Fe(II) oxygenase [Thiomicrospira aerophila]AHF01866.1 2OG-Fe(II) oxygenase [Thiomicrospira aerophila AL3]
MFNLQLESESINTAIDALVDKGWYFWHNAIPTSLCDALYFELQQRQQDGELQQAGIGRGQEHQLNQRIRRDAIHWLERQTPAQAQYLDLMQQLQLELNRQLFLGLFEYEAHFALYSPGDFYKKHRDSFRGAANRMVTSVTYLNPTWQADWGGELVLYNEEDTQELTRLMPQCGALALFMSEQLPHEVLPTRQPRASIAGWFRCNTSTHDLVNPPK